MAAVSELDFALASFWEFARIWRSGKKCKLNLSCDGGVGELHLVAGLGAADERHFPPQDIQQQRRKKTPSQLRREERRRKERQSKEAENKAVQASQEAENNRDIVTEEATKEENTDAKEEDPTIVTGGKVVEETIDVRDEFCSDSEFLGTKVENVKMCSVQIFPENNMQIKQFRETVENYFNSRKDIIEKVLECKIENLRSNIRLVSIVKIRKVWINFFNDPRGKYGDLQGVGRVLHDCRDLSNCDPVKI